MRYLRPYFATLIGALAIVAAVNALVDPFDVTGAPRLRGFNDLKSPGNERFYKPLQLSARQPHTVFLGSSRVMMALDPAASPDLDAYNFAISAATMTEEAAFARHAMQAAPANLLLMGLDFVSFNDAIEPSTASRIDDLGRHLILRSIPQLLISEQALVRSRGTILESRRRDEDVHRPNGFVIYPDKAMIHPERELRVEVSRYLASNRKIAAFDRSLAELDRLFADAAARGVRVVAFIPPSHAIVMETLWVDDATAAYEHWLRALTEICAARQVPLWDFSGFNALTTMALSDSYGTFFDGSHTRPWVGQRMLDAMIGGHVDPGFGDRLTVGGIDAHIAELRDGHAAWRNAHAADWDDLAPSLGLGADSAATPD